MSDHKQYLCSHLVTLHWEDQRTSANMEKIWPRGATFNAEVEAGAGTVLQISSPEWQAAGSVVNCKREDDGFLIDVEFAAGYVWDRNNFEPHHFTDLDVLLVRKLLSEMSPR